MIMIDDFHENYVKKCYYRRNKIIHAYIIMFTRYHRIIVVKHKLRMNLNLVIQQKVYNFNVLC